MRISINADYPSEYETHTAVALAISRCFDSQIWKIQYEDDRVTISIRPEEAFMLDILSARLHYFTQYHIDHNIEPDWFWDGFIYRNFISNS